MELNEQEKAAYEQAAKVILMADTEGWKDVLAPFLTQKMNQAFPDPAQFTNATDPKEAFFYAALNASIFKKVVAELLGFVEQKRYEIDQLNKKQKGELAKTRIGS